MKFLIFSDSHSRTNLMESLTEKYSSLISGIIHLGDCTEDVLPLKSICNDIPIYQVRGNNDYDCTAPAERIVEMCSQRIFMTHGHKQRVYYNTDSLYYSAYQNEAGIALFGHTHVPYLKNEGGILVMNPGSISLPRSDFGKTFGFLTFDNGKLEAAIMSANDKGIQKLFSISI